MEPKKLVRYPIVAVGLTTAAFICIKSARDAAFFSPTGIERLPPMFLVTQIGLALAATLHVASMRRYGTRATRLGAFIIVTAILGAAAPFTTRDHPALMALLFPLVPIVFAGLFSSAWLLAGDLLEGADPGAIKTAYLRIGVSGLLGGITGGSIARLVGDRVGSDGAAAVGVVLLALATIACHRGHVARPADAPPPDEKRQAPQVGLRRIFQDDYARAIAIVAALGAASSMLIEFQFYASASAAGTTDTNFFANWSVVTAAAAIILQLSLAPVMQARFGISGALLVLPVVIFFGAGSLILVATVLVPPLLRLGETAIRASVHQTSWEQIFLGYSREERAPMKVLLDGVIARITGIAGAIALWLLVILVGQENLGEATWLGAGLLVTAAAWVGFTRRLRPKAPQSLEGLDPMIRLPDS